MPTLEKTENGYKVTWIQCKKCGGPMAEVVKPTEAYNYRCLVCNHKAKIDERKVVSGSCDVYY